MPTQDNPSHVATGGEVTPGGGLQAPAARRPVRGTAHQCPECALPSHTTMHFHAGGSMVWCHVCGASIWAKSGVGGVARAYGWASRRGVWTCPHHTLKER